MTARGGPDTDSREQGCESCKDAAFAEPSLASIYRLLCDVARSTLRGQPAERSAEAHGVSLGNLRRLCREYIGVSLDDLVQFAGHVRNAHEQGDEGPMLVLALPYTPPLAFGAVLELLRAQVVPGVEYVGDSVYQRTFVESGSTGALEVRDGEGPSLDVRLLADRWTGLVHVAERVRRVFNVDVDAFGAHEWLCDDPVVGRLVRMRPGVRPPGGWSLFEAAIKAVLGCGWDVRGQEWLASVARSSGQRIETTTSLHLSQVFPSPEQVAAVPLDCLGLPFVKARTVRQLARVASAGSVVVVESQPMHRRLVALMGLDGVGPVTAARFAWILGDADAYPERSGSPLPGTLVTPSRRRARQVSDRWRPYRSFAYAQLALSDGPLGLSNESAWATVSPEDGLSA
jgi:AraC family transcriptional regulator, regulatory protein of adaptative response / DNA-3-methyladenine glycosylase II